MALFLTRTLEVLVDRGVIEPLPAPGPVLSDARADDVGLVGVVDAGDLHQLTASAPLALTADDPGQGYRLRDADGTTADLVCGTNATCTLQPGDLVLRLLVDGTVAPLTGAAGTDPSIDYPVTISHVTGGLTDPAGQRLLLDARADKVINVAPVTPAVVRGDVLPPDMIAADGDAGAATLVVIYREAVICEPSATSQFAYSDADSTNVHPSLVVCDGSDEVMLTFAPGILVAGDHGMLTYHDPNAAVDSDDVRDLSGNQSVANEVLRAFVL
jgi:hypothetical protein